MTSDAETANIGMESLLWQFIGSFTHVQDLLDNVLAKTFFDKRVPKVSALLRHRVVKRISDEERIKLFMAIADDLDSDVELGSYPMVYNRAKATRDWVAHSVEIRTAGNDQLEVIKNRTEDKPEGELLRLDRRMLTDCVHDCQWLNAQAAYVIFTSDLASQFSYGHELKEFFKPAGLPENWDGMLYRGRAAD